MNNNKSCLIAFLLIISQALIGQENLSSDLNKAIDTIPFELTDQNNISISAILNKQDTVQLMFHTATNSLSLTTNIIPKLSSLHWNNSEEVESWGGKSDARFSEKNALQINQLFWENLPIWETINSGPGTNGKFGPNLFEGKAIEIDFDNSVMVIHKHIPKKIKTYEKLKLAFENGFMFLEGNSKIAGENYPNKFLIHSGFGGTILYDDKFVADSKIGEHIVITETQELKDSYGNIIHTKKGILPKFTLGTAVFHDLPVGFFEGSIGRQKMSVLGGNLLKRFNLIIDAERSNIYLKSNQLSSLAY
ncbi:MAG TPA: hypothetical protein VJ953_14575 [Saprospiraceae bacterium]|nr:hypothetical protein [Saprospiraceae bacterium]